MSQNQTMINKEKEKFIKQREDVTNFWKSQVEENAVQRQMAKEADAVLKKQAV